MPVLVYADIHLTNQQENRIQQLKKKYILLFYTKDIYEVGKFCKMERLVWSVTYFFFALLFTQIF